MHSSTPLGISDQCDTHSRAPQDATPEPLQYVSSSGRMLSDASDTAPRPSFAAQCHDAMTQAFIRWHLTGDWSAAADYDRAREAWERALMTEGAVA